MLLSKLGLVKASGPQAKALLQGQLTCNLDDITPTQSRLAAHCNPQGRIISFFRLFIFNSDYYLQMPIELVPIAMQALQKYAPFYKVQLQHITNLAQYSANHLALKSLPAVVNQQLTSENFLIIKTVDSNT